MVSAVNEGYGFEQEHSLPGHLTSGLIRGYLKDLIMHKKKNGIS